MDTKETRVISRTVYNYLPGGKVEVEFFDYVHETHRKREYKNFTIASRESTKFRNRVLRSIP